MTQLFAFTCHRKLAQSLALCACLLGLCIFAAAGEPTIITFDPPGSAGTYAYQINAWGATVGWYFDATFAFHGFRRTPDGKITSYDAPGASKGPMQGTAVYSINDPGTKGGFYTDPKNVLHAFLLTANGKYTVFDAPNAGTGDGQGTVVFALNDLGVAAGGYINTGDWIHGTQVWHGFSRAADGTVAEYDAPGAGTAPGQGTAPCSDDCLNLAGTVVGFYVDATNVSHGYIRSNDGNITEFDPPGSTDTYPNGIDPAGDVVGVYTDANGVNHGFLRDKGGRITDIDVAGAGTGSGQGTIVNSIAENGAMSGTYVDANGVYHGFGRTPQGEITKFDVPGAGKSAGQGTGYLSSNNASGSVAGSYIDGNNVLHGFVWSRCDDDSESAGKPALQ